MRPLGRWDCQQDFETGHIRRRDTCASLAVRPCHTIEESDGKYVGRFFLGVVTLGLCEVTIRNEDAPGRQKVALLRQIAFRTGCHGLVARLTGAPPGRALRTVRKTRSAVRAPDRVQAGGVRDDGTRSGFLEGITWRTSEKHGRSLAAPVHGSVCCCSGSAWRSLRQPAR